MNRQYDILLKSIGLIVNVAESIREDNSAMAKFAGYLTQNEAEICKFGKVAKEVCEYLDNYDFVKSYQFNTMQTKLVPLHSLRMKLVKMGEEAKKLSAFPDRYGSKRAIEICKDLALTSMEKMSFAEMAKLESLVESNTQKLIEIQNLLRKDINILSQINALIENDKLILSRLRAYYEELKQYVSEFPHQGVDDLDVVKSHIALAKQIFDLWMMMDKRITDIKDYADRYDKGKLLDNYYKIVNGLITKMRYADVGHYQAQLNAVSSQVSSLCVAFEKEHDELRSLQTYLSQGRNAMWKEDDERILATVTMLLGKDTKKVVFDLNQIKTDYANAKNKRIDDVAMMVKQYVWLEKNKKYKDVHQKLLFQNITFSEYKECVKKLKTKRMIRIICWCIPVLGWILMPEIK